MAKSTKSKNWGKSTPSIDVKSDILERLARGEITPAMASAELSAISPVGSELLCKVSAKGALSVYGLGRWPVTLYAEQWDRLLAFALTIAAFRKSHASEFSMRE
jgi:alkylation response protein AidB-like acyl-CoA dehydrogenase